MNKFKQKFTSFLTGRNFSSGLLVAIIVAAVVFVNIITYTLSNFLGLYLYSPEEPDFTISDTFEERFRAAAESEGREVTVTFCMPEADVLQHVTGNYVINTAYKFAEKYPELIKLRFVNIYTKYDQSGNDVAEELERYQTDMLGYETPIKSTSVIFSSGSNYRVITDTYTSAGYATFYTLDSSLYMTSYNGEEIFAAMISWVITDEHDVAYFTVGHGESASANLQNLLICAGYYTDMINLRDPESTEKLKGADLVVISNPIADFERAAEGSSVITEYERLSEYIGGGGDLFVTVDPYMNKLTTLNSLLAEYGISVDRTDDDALQIIRDSVNGITTDGFTFVADFPSDGGDVSANIKSNIEKFGGRVILCDAAPLLLSGNAKPLLISSASSVCESGGAVTDNGGSYPVAAYSTKMGSTGEDSKIFFIPSVYLAATDAMVTNGYANKDFLYSLFDELFEQGDMPYNCNSLIYDDQTLENLTMGTARLYTAVLIALPVLILAVGAVVLIRRKNR